MRAGVVHLCRGGCGMNKRVNVVLISSRRVLEDTGAEGVNTFLSLCRVKPGRPTTEGPSFVHE